MGLERPPEMLDYASSTTFDNISETIGLKVATKTATDLKNERFWNAVGNKLRTTV
jgi:hypothetical protein